ncbi:YARHG domain-containing protein [Clostridium sp. OS1-26]|uniref:YARHG domain-containing protein n=1 Tax=Clostridium sp. OS1-26 TaxID=3070681 RepID=UPI0027E168E7|nr:YARHG domain-containing protein [Clostridium sp. OS1-26]WML34762.1 YARHG domain-containing protein [Clostridium sp. OS1-26]
MSNCKKCGTQFDENDKFCANCGTKREYEDEKIINEKVISSIENKLDENLQVPKPYESNAKPKYNEQTEPKIEIMQANKDTVIKQNSRPNISINDKANKTLKTDNIKEQYRDEVSEGKSRSFIIILVVLFILGFIGSYIFFISNNTKSDSNAEISNNSTVNSHNLDSNGINERVDNKLNEYIFPYSNVKPLELRNLKNMSKEKLALARNEIFARHGYIFTDDPYKSYFNKKSWYKPNPKFTGEGKQLSPLERHNIKIIMTAEGLEKNLAPNYDSDYNDQ